MKGPEFKNVVKMITKLRVNTSVSFSAVAEAIDTLNAALRGLVLSIDNLDKRIKVLEDANTERPEENGVIASIQPEETGTIEDSSRRE